MICTFLAVFKATTVLLLLQLFHIILFLLRFICLDSTDDLFELLVWQSRLILFWVVTSFLIEGRLVVRSLKIVFCFFVEFLGAYSTWWLLTFFTLKHFILSYGLFPLTPKQEIFIFLLVCQFRPADPYLQALFIQLHCGTFVFLQVPK